MSFRILLDKTVLGAGAFGAEVPSFGLFTRHRPKEPRHYFKNGGVFWKGDFSPFSRRGDRVDLQKGEFDDFLRKNTFQVEFPRYIINIKRPGKVLKNASALTRKAMSSDDNLDDLDLNFGGFDDEDDFDEEFDEDFEQIPMADYPYDENGDVDEGDGMEEIDGAIDPLADEFDDLESDENSYDQDDDDD